MTLATRPLERGDVPFAVATLSAEGWSFSEREIERILRLGGGLVAEEDGRGVGLLTLVLHEGVAWIGNVAVVPSVRGRGVGARLVDDAVAAAAARGAREVGLYSVLPAVSLYGRAGFRELGRVVSHAGVAPALPPPAGVERAKAGDAAAIARFDSPLSGFRRRRLVEEMLDAFPDSCFVLRGASGMRGFAVAKPSEAGAEIGPVVARAGDAHAVRALLDAALGALEGAHVEVGVPVAHAGATAHVAARGLVASFPAVEMRRGGASVGNPHAVVAVAGMEKG